MKNPSAGRFGILVLTVVLTVIRMFPALSSPSDASPASSPATVNTTPPPVQVLEPAAAEQKKEQLSTCITAIAAQSDPAKLATLGSRGANPRLKRIIYWLAAARDAGGDPGEVIDQAQKLNHSVGTPRAPLVKASLLRNLKICDGLEMLTPGNRASLRRGNAPIVRRGPYTGQTAEVDHIVPLAQAPEVGNELANLEMLPASLNRSKSDKVGERQLDLAKKFHAVGLISDATMAKVQARFRPSSTMKYERHLPVESSSDATLVAQSTPAPTPQPTLIVKPDGQQAVGSWFNASQWFAPKDSTKTADLAVPATGEILVWVNTKSHIYHQPHTRYYGRTQKGKYLSEHDALAEGDRAAKNHQ